MCRVSDLALVLNIDHWTAHRRIGRTYVLAGVLPGGLAGLVLAANTPLGPAIKVSSVMMALLWLGITLTGFMMARRGRFVEHRRWMIRSFALTCSTILNRFVGVAVFFTLQPQQETAFAGNETWFVQVSAGITGWFSWTVALLLAEWWLERKPYPAERDLAVRSAVRRPKTCLAPRDFRQAESA